MTVTPGGLRMYWLRYLYCKVELHEIEVSVVVYMEADRILIINAKLRSKGIFFV